jgi:hypothetical protein
MHKLFMFPRNVYATQPYLVGSKDRKSLAIIIPARLVKEYDVDTSTIFAVRADKRTKSILMYMVPSQHESLEDSDKQSVWSSR